MIAAENSRPSIDEFRQLMESTDIFLNREAAGREDYFSRRSGLELEKDVYEALCICATNTPFEDSIRLVSGASFPDIIASRFYGVEVKSTSKNHWTSIGSSILESTRNPDVERIFLTFGKLAKPVSFMSRPYEECLSGISVTHYPRYQIDMRLDSGQTIFDKIGIPYDKLRLMDNPVSVVSRYYKSRLKEGETLWWAADTPEEETAASPVLRLWSSLSLKEKDNYIVMGYALFPEILSQKSNTKYQRYALWLVSKCSIVNTNIRDLFSSGGKRDIETAGRTYERVPAAFGRIEEYKELIRETILETDEKILSEYWQTNDISKDRISMWIDIVSKEAATEFMPCSQIRSMLLGIFFDSSQ